MLRKEAIDKSDWPPGIWHQEPDEAVFESSGYSCLIWRTPDTGYLCGYVRIPLTHPKAKSPILDPDLNVHGCTTLSEEWAPGHNAEEEFWWIGFDCNHLHDLVPNPGLTLFEEEWDSYRNFVFVRQETTNLASQLKRIADAAN